MSSRIAVVPGYFDPPTLGHLDVIRRASTLYDELHVLVVHNPAKEAMLPIAQRLSLLEQSIAEDGVEGDVRLRDISATGAMIEGIAIDGAPQDFDVLIELVKDRMIAAKLRWASDGRAGIEFVEPIDVDLVTNAPQRALRRAG